MTQLAPIAWKRGATYLDYRRGVERNGEVLDEVFAAPVYTEGELAWLGSLPALKIVAIGEDWCPDVYQTLPTWARVADELPGWELKVFARDQNSDLMEAFLWKGRAQRIPVYAFYDEALRLQVWWSGRAAEPQAELDQFLAGRSYADLGKAGIRELVQWSDVRYSEEFRRKNFEEMLALLSAFFHLALGAREEPR